MKISVITVCYNAVDTLEATMQSVLEQTYRDIEYIIIDGGSTDGTIDIIRKYEDCIAYWVSEPDKGIYDAMNKGIKVATGEWVNFMNAGDRFVNEKILDRIFEKNIPQIVDVIYGNTLMRYMKRMIAVKVKELDYMRIGMPFCHQSSFVHNNVIEIFDTSYRIAADYKFFYEFYLEKGVNAFMYIDMPIAIFDARDGISANVVRTYSEYLQVRKIKYWQIRVALFNIAYTLGRKCKIYISDLMSFLTHR